VSRWPVGTSGAAQLFGAALMFIVAGVAGVLASNSLAALLEQRAQIILVYGMRLRGVRVAQEAFDPRR
jgi:hypothetical protein